jgi:hypothetical protein
VTVRVRDRRLALPSAARLTRGFPRNVNLGLPRSPPWGWSLPASTRGRGSSSPCPFSCSAYARLAPGFLESFD